MPRSSLLVTLFAFSVILFVALNAFGQTTDKGTVDRASGGGVSYPKIINSPTPSLSEEATQVLYLCNPVVKLVVSPEGLPRDVSVPHPCDLGIDKEVIDAVGKGTFDPSRKNGQPVAVQIELQITLEFALKLDSKGQQALIERAKGGDTLAELQLSNQYLQGTAGFSQDLSLGQQWQLKAAADGQPIAQFLLARRLADQDLPGAYMWYSLAKEQGYEPAGVKLADLSTRMSPEQLSGAQARILEWKKTKR